MSNPTVTNNDVVTQNVSSDDSRVTGCVKWFNNKAGYGFVTVSSGPHAGDVFVHHSAVNVVEEQYRFLVQGEYVEFDCIRVDDGPHQWQAANVTGPNSGRLMCETRRTVRSTRSTDEPEQSSRPRYEQSSRPRPQYRESREPRVSVTDDYRARRPQTSHGPRGVRQPSVPDEDGYEWLLVRRYPNNESGPRGVRPQRVVDRSGQPHRRVRSVVQTPDTD